MISLKVTFTFLTIFAKVFFAKNLQSKIVNLISKIMYPEEMVKPMRAELTDAGFQELYSAEAVENA